MYVIGDYVQGINFDLIYLDLIGMVDEDKLKEVTEKKRKNWLKEKSEPLYCIGMNSWNYTVD